MGDIKWIKLSTGLMNDSKIKHIRSARNGDTMALMWVLLLCRAGMVNDGGRVYVAPGVPYSIAGLAEEFRVPRKVAEDAVKLFEQLGMISVTDDALVITQWDKHQNISSLERIRETSRETSRKYREKKKSDAPSCHGDVTRDSEVTRGDATEEEKEEDIDIKKKLGINDAYKTSTRACASAAQLLIDRIAEERLLDMLPNDLHSVVFDALQRGVTPERVYVLAKQSGRSWAAFASGCATEGGGV